MRKVLLVNGTVPSSVGAGILPGANTASWYTASPVSAGAQHVGVAQDPLVMVIDDSITVRKIVETCLVREGFYVESFSDGVEAMRWLIGPDARIPNLIILDIGLPKMDGYEVARHLKTKSQFSKTVILMLSGRDGEVDRLKGLLVGAREYLVKPVETQNLISVVKSCLGKPI